MNPEFRRNLWLEFSLERLAIVPAVIGLALIALGGTLGRPAAVTIATYAATAIGVIWGCTQSSSSLLGEITGRTWDSQRASSLSGWQMTWGKLLGATSYVWYAVVVVFAAWIAIDGQATRSRDDWLMLVPASLLAQAVALIAALIIAQDGRVHARAVRQAAAIGVLAGLAAMQPFRVLAVSGAPSWYAMNADRGALVLGSLLFLCFWAVVGAWRSMAAALQIPLRAWAWPSFLLTLSTWLAGFVAGGDPQTVISRRLYVALAATWLATWIAALVESKSPVKMRQWGSALAGGNIALLLARTPAWLIGLPIVMGLGVGVASTDDLAPGLSRFVASVPIVGRTIDDLLTRNGAWLSVLGILLFLWRDIAIMYGAGLIGRGRRVPALVYLAALYILVPAALLALGWPSLIPAFIPLPFAEGVFDVAFATLVIEIIFATAIAARAVRRLTTLVR